MRRSLLSIAVAACAVLACSNTKMLSTWKSPEYKNGSIHKVLVVGIFKTDGVREIVEGTYVDLFKAEQVEAAASHSFFTPAELRVDAVAQKVQELKYDGVLLTRVLDRDMQVKHYPPAQEKTAVELNYPGEWHEDYVTSVDEIETIGHTVNGPTVARVETRLYDARTRKVVWSAVSETSVDGENVPQIRHAVGKLVDKMVTARLF
jgi:hypothetical protein